MENELTLGEKLLLLAVRPNKGGIMWASSQSIDFCLIGATILEMELNGNVSISEKRVKVNRDISTSTLFNYFLEKMVNANRPRKIGHWMEAFVISKKRVRNELYQSLVQKREIRLEDRRFLFFTWKKPWLTPSNHTWDLINNIKNQVYQNSENLHDLYLAALLEPAELWGRIFPEWAKRRSAKQKIKQYLDKTYQSEMTAHGVESVKAVRQAIRASVAARRAAAT
jgi:golgi phosphoprotein 3